MMKANLLSRVVLGCAVSAALSLMSACGGGGDSGSGTGTGTGSGGGGGGAFTISAATPAANNTTVDFTTSGASGYLPHGADSLSSTPYCEVYYESALGANGTRYALQVMFRQADKAALKVVVFGDGGWYPEAVATGGAALSGIAIDTAKRTMTFTARTVAGTGGAVGTLDGSVALPAASSGCGA